MRTRTTHRSHSLLIFSSSHLATFAAQVKDDDPPEYVARLNEINSRLIERTLAAGGSCTGEHGIGVGKKQYLQKQYGAEAVEMMRVLKRAMDPLNILNPGKVVDV